MLVAGGVHSTESDTETQDAAGLTQAEDSAALKAELTQSAVTITAVGTFTGVQVLTGGRRGDGG